MSLSTSCLYDVDTSVRLRLDVAAVLVVLTILRELDALTKDEGDTKKEGTRRIRERGTVETKAVVLVKRWSNTITFAIIIQEGDRE